MILEKQKKEERRRGREEGKNRTEEKGMKERMKDK